MKTFIFVITALLMGVVAVYSESYSESQRLAVQKYPDLGVAGSELNKKFIIEVESRRKSNAKFFESPDWPLKLADDLSRPPIIPGLSSMPIPVSVAAPKRSGRFSATITYESSNGRKGDEYADLLLLPEGRPSVKLKIPQEIDIRNRRSEGLPSELKSGMPNLEPTGAFYASADVDGNVSISTIPPGRYVVIVRSAHTKADPKASAALEMLSMYFTDEYVKLVSPFRLTTELVQIPEGEELHKTYYFPW